MFNKATNFRMLPSGHTAPGTKAPANDNRRNAHTGASRRPRAPLLVCRWSLSPSTGRPVCRWELDKADEPSPPTRKALRRDRPLHKTVFQPSYQDEAAGAGLRGTGCASDTHALVGHTDECSRVDGVLHARHWTMRLSASPGPAPSQRERFALSLVANDLQLITMSCAGFHLAC
jgi:hypothetical protein